MSDGHNYLSVVLSTRQREVLLLIEQGYDTDEIAGELGISRSSVRSKVKRLLKIFGGTYPELPARARANGANIY